MQLFKTGRLIETQIDEFLDAVVEGVLVYKEGILSYLRGDLASLEAKIKAIQEMESRADRLSCEVEAQLYSHSLIPEHRGDVLGLLETTDNIIDTAKSSLYNFSVEHPEIPEELVEGFSQLAEASYLAAEAVIVGARAFFRDVDAVKDNLFKVHHYEKEADSLSDALKREIFGMDLELARKMQLRFFANDVEKVSDQAEQVADRLAISAIKRKI